MIRTPSEPNVYRLPVELHEAAHLRSATSNDFQAREPGRERAQGLCMNCDLRDTCAFPAPEGGVWHCEEYA